MNVDIPRRHLRGLLKQLYLILRIHGCEFSYPEILSNPFDALSLSPSCHGAACTVMELPKTSEQETAKYGAGLAQSRG